MASTDLTMSQRKARHDAACDRREWCRNVVDRAKALGWPQDDPVVVAAQAGYEAMHALLLAVSASGPTHPPMEPLPTRAEVMARRKRGAP